MFFKTRMRRRYLASVFSTLMYRYVESGVRTSFKKYDVQSHLYVHFIVYNCCKSD